MDAVLANETIKGPVWDFSGQLSLVTNLAGPQNGWYDLDDHQVALKGDFAFAGFPQWVSLSADPRPGIVQIFQRSPGAEAWSLAQTLNKPAGTASNARFGSAVAMRDTTCWIGASGDDSGSVFQYKLGPNGQWVRTNLRLRSAEARSGEEFGAALAQGDSWLAVGVPKASEPGNPEVGAVDIFDSSTGSWQARLFSPSPRSRTYFGRTLVGDGDTLCVFEEVLKEIVVFSRSSAGTWTHSASIRSPDPNPMLHFANAIAFSGGVLLVGVPTESDSVPGRIHAFEQNPNLTWRQTWRFEPRGPSAYITRVAINGNRAALHFFVSGNTSSEVQLWQREADATWTPLGTTTQTDPLDQATGGAFAVALSDRSLLQTGIVNSSPRLRFYLHHTDANVPPVIHTSPVLFGEEGRLYSYHVRAVDENPGDAITLTAGALPSWLAFSPGETGSGVLEGTPTVGVTGDFPIELSATDSSGGTSVQRFTLRVLSTGGLPVIASVSPDQTLNDYERLELSVVLEDDGAATYQWYADGVLLEGQIAATLVIDRAQAADAGLYTVRVNGLRQRWNPPPSASGSFRFPTGSVATGRRSGIQFPQRSVSRRHLEITSSFRPGPRPSPPMAARSTKSRSGRGRISSVSAMIAARLRYFMGWTRKLAQSFGLEACPSARPSAPRLITAAWFSRTTHEGRIRRTSEPLDAGTGTLRWTRTYSDQYAIPYAPVVNDAGIYSMGGEHGGLYFHNPAGLQQWFVRAGQRDRWTPLLHDGRLYHWLGGLFSELDLADGHTLWSLTTPWTSWEWYSVMTVPADYGHLVALLDIDAMRVVNLAERNLSWTRSGSFVASSPAIGDGLVYAITHGAVLTYRAEDGTELDRYPTLDAAGAPRNAIHQPLVLDDHLLVSSESETWVFDRQTRILKQRLSAGGPLTYTDGLLYAAGLDGVLRAFAVNQPPVIIPPTEPFVWTEDTPREWTLAVSDPDGDALSVRVEGRPVWMSVGDPIGGVIRLSGMPTLSSQSASSPSP